MTDCHFCAQVAGDMGGDLLTRLVGGAGPTVAVRSERFAVMASVGAVAFGHGLIVPTDHLTRMAAVPASDRSEYEAFKAYVGRRVAARFEAPVHFFEHGSDARGHARPCTVDHAHTHVLPAPCEVVDHLPQEHLWVPVAPTLDALVDAVGGREYLYYEGPDGRAFVTSTAGAAYPSQLLRRLFVDELRPGTDWNWRTEPRLPDLRRTVAALGDLFAPTSHRVASSGATSCTPSPC